MKPILRDNALEAWAAAIKYSNFILAGKATLQYRKQFVSSLHNAVELFVKQLMLDKNDHRVCTVKNVGDAAGHPAVDFYKADDLNAFFGNISDNEMKKFYSVEYNEICKLSKELFQTYYNEFPNDKTEVCDAFSLLGRLRNKEVHFFIDEKEFLTDREFQKLYNFMITFEKILHYFSLLPYWGEAQGEFVRYRITTERLQNFSYKKAVRQSEFYRYVKSRIDGKAFPANGDTVYDFAEDIYFQLQTDNIDFDELWTCIAMAVRYELLSYEDVVEEYDEPEIGAGANVYRMFLLK